MTKDHRQGLSVLVAAPGSVPVSSLVGYFYGALFMEPLIRAGVSQEVPGPLEDIALLACMGWRSLCTGADPRQRCFPRVHGPHRPLWYFDHNGSVTSPRVWATYFLTK